LKAWTCQPITGDCFSIKTLSIADYPGAKNKLKIKWESNTGSSSERYQQNHEATVRLRVLFLSNKCRSRERKLPLTGIGNWVYNCDAWPVLQQTCRCLPSPTASQLFGCHQIILQKTHVCEQLAQSYYVKVKRSLRRSRAWAQTAAATLLGNSLKQTVHTHRASVHQAAKEVAALLRVVRVTAGLAESNGSLLPGL